MKWIVLISLLLADPVQAADDIRFITCPIYRDTDAGKKSGCWLADDPSSGQRYDVSGSASKPDWNYAVLVEGRPSPNQDDACGGRTLNPVRTSILDTHCPHHALPDEGFPGRKFVLPKRNVDPLSVKRPEPTGRFETKVFRLYFDWNSQFLAYQREDWSLDQTITWIRAAPYKTITVTGYAATIPTMVSGQSLQEPTAMSAERAGRVAAALIDLGIPQARIKVVDGGLGSIVADDWVDDLREPSRRRVEIEVNIN